MKTLTIENLDRKRNSGVVLERQVDETDHEESESSQRSGFYKTVGHKPATDDKDVNDEAMSGGVPTARVYKVGDNGLSSTLANINSLGTVLSEYNAIKKGPTK